jgi:mannose/cellobiose epimerase-like protein (N-acyl-D-glucosamine 2-epimerase family)
MLVQSAAMRKISSQATKDPIKNSYEPLTQLAQAKVWLKDHALPFWSKTGFDQTLLSFHERTDFNGNPLINTPRRTMAQARQIYVFSHAYELGWCKDGGNCALQATRSLIKRHWRVDGSAGWIFSVTNSGQIHDARRDTYSHAFALLGLAWAYRLEPSKEFKQIADETFTVLDTLFAAQSFGGFIDGAPRLDSLRRQNPHMHLFEAALAWFEATGEAKYLARAGEIFGLFSTRFFDPETGALGEYFDECWNPAASSIGNICEPGHHFEWVWLLLKFFKLSGRDVSLYSEALFNHALKFGRASNGLLHDEICKSGAIIKNSQRCWPLTEAIKALSARIEMGEGNTDNVSHEELIADFIECLMNNFLGRPFNGGWIDHLNADGSPKVDFVPSSTLYHAFLAIAEADRVFKTNLD